MADDDGSLFEQMMAQAVAPFEIELRDGDTVEAWTLAAVDPDGVAVLDDNPDPIEALDGLLGGLADDVFAALDSLPRSTTVDLYERLRAHFALTDGVESWTTIVDQIDCYGGDIESDLLEYRGMNLLDWFRGRHPWPQLLRLLARLPSGSRYLAAVLDDEELARERLEKHPDDDTGRSTRPSLIGETPDRAMLRELLNTARQTRWAVIAVQAPKGKAGKPPAPLKGPETAEERLKLEMAKEAVEDIFDQATPWWRDQVKG